MPKTLYQKIWENHLVKEFDNNLSLLYVDLHLLHEVTSPQAFEGLRINKRTVRQTSKSQGTLDHNVPTANRNLPIADETSRAQVFAMQKNCKEFGVELFDLNDIRQGIVHIVGPEQGLTQPGMIVVCGDSHTSTHGAFGALAFGIGTSEVEHVLATQTLLQKKSKTMRINFTGSLPSGIYSKDMILALIGKIGAGGGAGYVLEYAGDTIKNLTMEGRLTICNMSIEAGARAGIIAPDEKTFNYIKGKPNAPKDSYWSTAVKYWNSLYSDLGAKFDKEVTLDVSLLKPQVTWGTSPDQVTNIDGVVPKVTDFETESQRLSTKNALTYMGLNGGEKIRDIKVDRVFIGSCTNSRIEDLRLVAKLVKGKKVNKNVRAMIVPGSGLIKQQAEQEGLVSIFNESGFEWRDAGCSMCLGMNEDILQPGERCASTSNRNYEGRQGRGGRTHLVSPAIAAATAIAGNFTTM